MGDLQVAENFIDRTYIIETATGNPWLVQAPTCTIVDELGNRSVGTVAEMTNGWYKCTDFTPDAAGTWCTEWVLAGATFVGGAVHMFKVGGGEVTDIKTETADIHTDVGTAITASGTAAAYAIVNSGLGFRGIVTAAVAGVSFTIGTLAGLGAGIFADATSPWFAYVLRDASSGTGGAPQGEYRQVLTYVTASGLFTTNAFSVAVAAGDDVIITSNILANVINIIADTNELQTDWVNGGRLDLLIDAIKARTDHHLITRAFFSPSQKVVTLPAAAADQTLPSVTLPNITGTIVHVYAGFKFRMIENTNAAANKLTGAQEIQVRVDTPGAYADAINFVDDQFGVAITTREGGDCIIGYVDLVGTVTAFNDIYEFLWDEAVADVASLVFNDVQTFLIVSYY